MAAVGGATEPARLLMTRGADANRASRGPGDRTPLCAAACRGYAETERALLVGGANPNLVERGPSAGHDDVTGCTPLQWAVQSMHLDATVALLEAGADPTASARRS